MNLCFVCNEYPPGPHGGIGTCTQVLGHALVAAGHSARVIGYYPPDYPAPDYEDDHGVRVWRLRGTTSPVQQVRGRIRLFRQIRQWARAGEIDLVEVPDYQGMAAFWPRLDIPVITRANSSTKLAPAHPDDLFSQRALLLERASLRRSDAWCAVSQYLADAIQSQLGLPPARAVLHNAIEIPPDLPDHPRHPAEVVFSGTLEANKGIIALIRAWNEVIGAAPEAVLHLYGKDGQFGHGSMREHLLTLLSDQARDSVVFHDHVPRDVLFRALQTAQAAVFPSYYEAFAFAPLEAMANGCPTIFTKRASGPELVEDGVNGLLVNPDHPAEIAAAIQRLIQDGELAKRIGNAGRDQVREKYAADVLFPKNERFYAMCLSAFRSGKTHNPAYSLSTGRDALALMVNMTRWTVRRMTRALRSMLHLKTTS